MNNEFVKLLVEMDASHPDKTEKIVKSFISFLREKGIDYQLPQILKLVQDEVVKGKEDNTLQIILSESTDAEEIRKKIAPNAEVNILIDKKLKGGFIAQYQGKLYNGSISRQLEKIRQKILCP